MLLDYYELHFLRFLGEHALSQPGHMYSYEEEIVEPIMNIYEQSAEGASAIDKLVDHSSVPDASRITVLAAQARIWGGEFQAAAVNKILHIADEHELQGYTQELGRHEVIRALIKAQRPDIAHVKLIEYETPTSGWYRPLLKEVGESYSAIATSKKDLEVVEPIIAELKATDPNPYFEITRGYWIFKRKHVATDRAVKRQMLHSPLMSTVRSRQYTLDHPENYIYESVPAPEKYPYARAYREGGLQAAFALHAHHNRASQDPSPYWRFSAVTRDLAHTGETEAARQIAEEGLQALAEYKGAASALDHYHLFRDVIAAYAQQGDLEQAHDLAMTIPQNSRDIRTDAVRSIVEHYMKKRISDTEQTGDTLVTDAETCIDYINQHIAKDDSRYVTFEGLIKDLAPHGQVAAMKLLAAQLPPQYRYAHIVTKALGVAHIVNKDYLACSELLGYWPDANLALQALTSVVQEKQARKLREPTL